MTELHEIAEAYRGLLAEIEADDATPGAVFARAQRAALTSAPKSRAWKARTLRLDPAPLHNAIALSGMVPLQIDNRWHLAVAVPQPSPISGDTADIEDIVLIAPATNKAHVLGDPARSHISPCDEPDRVMVMVDPLAWARSIALERLDWYRMLQLRRRALKVLPTWTGGISSALLLVEPKLVRWSDIRSGILEVPADLRKDVQRAIFAQARLPRVEGRA